MKLSIHGHLMQVRCIIFFKRMKLGDFLGCSKVLIACIIWEWSSCPMVYHGEYRGHKGKSTIILEAVASKSLQLWHVFFGMLGSHNDINVIQRSPVFDDSTHGRTVSINFTVNGHQYNMRYHLWDKIYLEWATIVKTKSHPMNAKYQTFATTHESTRIDVERAFGVLRSKFRIIQNSCRMWSPKDMYTMSSYDS
jgi:hypothetical protein